MLHLVASYMRQNKSRKQTLESAQNGLEIIFKTVIVNLVPMSPFCHALEIGTPGQVQRHSQSRSQSLRSPCPAVGEQDLWEQPFWNNKGNNRILPIRVSLSLHLWRMPEMVAPRALDSCRRPEGSWALGTRMLYPWKWGGRSLPLGQLWIFVFLRLNQVKIARNKTLHAPKAWICCSCQQIWLIKISINLGFVSLKNIRSKFSSTPGRARWTTVHIWFEVNRREQCLKRKPRKIYVSCNWIRFPLI